VAMQTSTLIEGSHRKEAPCSYFAVPFAGAFSRIRASACPCGTSRPSYSEFDGPLLLGTRLRFARETAEPDGDGGLRYLMAPVGFPSFPAGRMQARRMPETS